VAEALRVPRIVVIGGGTIGAATVRQLRRAIAAGRLQTERVVVVDRDPACAAGRTGDPRVAVVVAEWSAWLERDLDRFGEDDHLVPYHWAPHLLLGWLESVARRAGGEAVRGADVPPLGVPFEQATRDSGRALSYATWTCPTTCIEPALCPHTRGPKDWSLCGDLEGSDRLAGSDERIVFRCLHLVYGVGTVPLRDVLHAGRRVAAAAPLGPRRYLVATSSHCHALAATLTVAPRRR
jgi:hypothetical protein